MSTTILDHEVQVLDAAAHGPELERSWRYRTLRAVGRWLWAD